MCTNAYKQMILGASQALADAIRQAPNPRDVYVFAIHTTDKRNGRFQISADYPAGEDMPFEVIRAPNTSDGKWASVAYSCMHQRLYEACHQTPILPIHGFE